MNRTSALRSMALLILQCGLFGGVAGAQQADSSRIAELERRLEAVTREIERLSLGGEVVRADSSVMGFGPAASKVYRVTQGVSIGGYGEILYENFGSEREDGVAVPTRDVADALRAVLYFGYKFDDRLLVNTEIEIEHASEAYLEFAYVEYELTENVGLRAGLLLAPLGLVNELHEPPIFLDTKRSVTEQRVIPTTWRENGIGVFGTTGRVAWRAYVMNSLNSAGFSSVGLRGGRQRGARALSENLALVGRADYVGVHGLLVGGSAFYGGTGQGRRLAGAEVIGNVLLWDAHLDYVGHGFDVRALLARASLDEASEINQLNALTGAAGVGDELVGWYVEGGYDLLRSSGFTHQLLPFVRYEEVDTHMSTSPGVAEDLAQDLSVLSLGAAWKPGPQVVLKLARQIHSNGASTGLDQWNVQLGWIF